MGLAAYMDLCKPKYSFAEVTEIIHCGLCGHPQESVLMFGAMWVCPTCFEEMEEKFSSKGGKK